MFRFMQPLKIPLQESLGRQWQLFTDILTAWVALPSLPVAEIAVPQWHRVQKICGKSLKVWNSFFVFHQNQLRCIQKYNIFNTHSFRCQKYLTTLHAVLWDNGAKFLFSQVNLAAQYQLLRRGSTAPLRVQTNGKFSGFPKFPITDSKMTFEKHLRSVSRAASQRLGILRKFWRVFHDRALLWRCFRGLSCQF